jgi:chromosome segregation ATPase
MTITKADCRREGIDEAMIAHWEELGQFEPTDPIEERRDDLTGEIEETTENLAQWESELAELTEQISQGRERLATLWQQLSELPPATEDE